MVNSEMEYFLTLQQSSLEALQNLCSKANLSTSGSKEQLIQQLLSPPETEEFLPQAIPLRTLDDNGKQVTRAINTFKHWRKQIFNSKNNMKEFTLVNSQGKVYKNRLRYIQCSMNTLKFLIENRWYFAQVDQRGLIESLRQTPEKFDVNIIQKPSGKGSSWLMLHVQQKAA